MKRYKGFFGPGPSDGQNHDDPQGYGDPYPQNYGGPYPQASRSDPAKKSRLVVNILRTVLYALALVTAVLPVIFPIMQVSLKGSSRSNSFSTIDTITGQFALNSFTEQYESFFEKNNFKELLVTQYNANQENGQHYGIYWYGTHAASTDEQAKADVAYKRVATRSFTGYMRVYAIESYYNTIKENAQLLYQGSLNQSMMDTVDKKLEDTQEVFFKIYELFPYEVEHMNYSGLLHFFKKLFEAEDSGDFSSRTMELLMSDYLLTSYNADALYPQLTTNMDAVRSAVASTGTPPLGSAASLLPDLQDAFKLSGDVILSDDPPITFNNTAGTDFYMYIEFSISILVDIAFALILTLISTIWLIHQWIDSEARIRTSHKGLLLFFCMPMTLLAFALSSSLMTAHTSPMVAFIWVLTGITFVYEIVCNIFVRNYRRKYMPKRRRS